MPKPLNAIANQFALPFKPFIGKEPFAQLIRATAIKEWKLIALNVSSSVAQAVFEAGALGVVFLTVKALASPSSAHVTIFEQLPFQHFVALRGLTQQISSTTIVLCLLSIAVFFQLLQSLAKYLNQLSTGYFAARCRAFITSQIYRQVFNLTFGCASSYKVGDLIDYVNSAQDAIRLHIDNTSLYFTGIAFSLMYLVVLVNISPWLLIGVVLILSVIWLLQNFILPRIASGAVSLTNAQVEVNARMTESFQALRFLHTSGQTEQVAIDLSRLLANLEHQLRKQSQRLSIVAPILSFLPVLAIFLVASLALLLLGGSSSGVLPGLITFVLSLQRLNANLSGMSGNLNMMADNYGRLKRIDEILSDDGKSYRRTGGISFHGLKQSIEFRSVSHSYQQNQHYVLNKVSFQLLHGQTLAIVGPSGSGKSTIIDLLVGLYHPSCGQICIDGISLDKLDLISWQSSLGVVSQDTFLFNATIAENLSYGLNSSQIPLSEITEACVRASLHDFIESLPSGYNTVVGERGYRLSGGQRQRLALARALLRKPELLILDEATSALDSRTEKSIQSSLLSSIHKQTTIVIAHRLSTIVHADQIIVVDQGSVVEAGTHQQLLSRSGHYHQLWTFQTSTT